jgi:hypothetical protein
MEPFFSVSLDSNNTEADATSLQKESVQCVKNDMSQLEQFLQYLIDENILTRSNRTIQTKIFTDVLKENKFKMVTFSSVSKNND